MTTLKSLCGSQQTAENSSREGIQDHLTYFLRNLYAGQTAAVRTGHGAMDWIQIGKGVCQGCILLPCFSSVQFTSVAQSCLTLCNPMECSMPGLPVRCQLLELTQTHVHQISDAIQPRVGAQATLKALPAFAEGGISYYICFRVAKATFSLDCHFRLLRPLLLLSD